VKRGIEEISHWVDQLEMSNNVLAMDSLCFREWARLMEGKSDHLLEEPMIAATARVNVTAAESRIEKTDRLARSAGLTRSAFLVRSAIQSRPAKEKKYMHKKAFT
jgi:hypothetical protein